MVNKKKEKEKQTIYLAFALSISKMNLKIHEDALKNDFFSTA